MGEFFHNKDKDIQGQRVTLTDTSGWRKFFCFATIPQNLCTNRRDAFDNYACERRREINFIKDILNKGPTHSIVGLFKVNFNHEETSLSMKPIHNMSDFLGNNNIFLNVSTWDKTYLTRRDKFGQNRL